MTNESGKQTAPRTVDGGGSPPKPNPPSPMLCANDELTVALTELEDVAQDIWDVCEGAISYTPELRERFDKAISGAREALGKGPADE